MDEKITKRAIALYNTVDGTNGWGALDEDAQRPWLNAASQVQAEIDDGMRAIKAEMGDLEDQWMRKEDQWMRKSDARDRLIVALVNDAEEVEGLVLAQAKARREHVKEAWPDGFSRASWLGDALAAEDPQHVAAPE